MTYDPTNTHQGLTDKIQAEINADLSCSDQSAGSVSQRLEELGGREVTGKQLKRITSAVSKGQNAALDAMEERLSREKLNDSFEPRNKGDKR